MMADPRYGGIRRGVARRPVAAFAVLACVLSWAWWLSVAALGEVVTSGVGWPTHLPGLLGPMVAAFVVTWVIEGRAGVRALAASMVAWRAGWWWAAVPVILAAGVLALVATGWGGPARELAVFPGVSANVGAVVTLLYVFVVNGLGEETGWRGFAAARLLRTHSLPVTSLAVAAPWAVWHLPLFLILGSFQDFSPALAAGWFLGLTAGSYVLTWLYRGSGGSVLLVAAWHTAYNLTSATPAASGTVAAVTSTLVIVTAAGIALAGLRGRGSRARVRPGGA